MLRKHAALCEEEEDWNNHKKVAEELALSQKKVWHKTLTNIFSLHSDKKLYSKIDLDKTDS